MKEADNLMDKMVERVSRGVARRTSRRGLFGLLGAGVVGAASLPLLPVARAAGSGQPKAADVPDSGDDMSCDYWRYCAIDGFLCTCCGGSVNTCPPGTEMSPITWIGTCRNPADGLDYLISYNDCCGISACGRCLCDENEGDRPIYVTAKTNDINWCLANRSTAYNSTVALVLGIYEGE